MCEKPAFFFAFFRRFVTLHNNEYLKLLIPFRTSAENFCIAFHYFATTPYAETSQNRFASCAACKCSDKLLSCASAPRRTDVPACIGNRCSLDQHDLKNVQYEFIGEVTVIYVSVWWANCAERHVVEQSQRRGANAVIIGDARIVGYDNGSDGFSLTDRLIRYK